MENESEKELAVAESIDTEEESVDEMDFDESEESNDNEESASDEEKDQQNDSEESNYDNLEDNSKDELTKEERAMYAKARRTIEKSTEKKHKEALDRAYQRGRLEAYKGKINPFTNTEIKDITDVEVYEDMYKISESGGDPLKDYASYAADRKREEERIRLEEETRQVNAQKEIEDFEKRYPDVNLSELLNDDNFKDYAEGKSKTLIDLYESYDKFTTAFRNKGIETAKKTIANTISSPGSLSAGSENVVDYATMPKEEFEKVVAKVKSGNY